jgi:hypothetical protein
MQKPARISATIVCHSDCRSDGIDVIRRASNGPKSRKNDTRSGKLPSLSTSNHVLSAEDDRNCAKLRTFLVISANFSVAHQAYAGKCRGFVGILDTFTAMFRTSDMKIGVSDASLCAKLVRDDTKSATLRTNYMKLRTFYVIYLGVRISPAG